MDIFSRAKRRRVMQAVGTADTRPEIAVRRLVFGMGYRYRLHVRSLPGTPDLVFTSRRKVIFVHGCFWHRHAGCPLAYTPKSRPAFWSRKFAGNVRRDRKVETELRKLGWRVVVVWECQTRRPEGLESRIRRLLRLPPADPKNGDRSPRPPAACRPRPHCLYSV